MKAFLLLAAFLSLSTNSIAKVSFEVTNYMNFGNDYKVKEVRRAEYYVQNGKTYLLLTDSDYSNLVIFPEVLDSAGVTIVGLKHLILKLIDSQDIDLKITINGNDMDYTIESK